MIILDISDVDKTVDAGLVYVQNDSVHLLEMTIQDNGAAVDLTGKTAKIRFCTRNGFVSDEPCTIVSAAAGTLSYKMLGAQLVRGAVLGIVSLYVGDERQSTSKFRLLCVDDLSSDDSVRDSVQYSELQKAITAAEAATGEANEAAEYAQSQGDYAKEKGDAVSLEWEPHVADEVIHITAEERAGWNNKVDKVTGKGLSANDYTDAEKAKLAGVQEGAQANVNGYGAVYIDGSFDFGASYPNDSIGFNSGDNVQLVSEWDPLNSSYALKISATDTTYENATDITSGLMSSADKAKLNGIETGAEKNVVTSVAGKTGAVALDKSDVGLPNVKDLEQAGKAEFDAHDANEERHITPQERARWDASAIVGDASGEKIVLDDIAPQGAVRELEIYGKSTQQTSTQGKNLLDMTGCDKTQNGITYAYQSDGGVKISGTATAYSQSRLINITERLTRGKTYVRNSVGGSATFSFQTVLTYNDGKSPSYPTTFTFDDTVNTVEAYLQVHQAGVTVDTTVYLQVEEGSVATAYEPFVPNKPSPEYPSEIKSAENFTALFLRGKNLLDTTGIDNTKYGITYARQADGGVKVSGTSTSAWSASRQIDITKWLTRGKTYTSSMTGGTSGLYLIPLITRKDGTNSNRNPFTYDDTVSSIKVYLQINDSGVTIDRTVYLQIEEGSAATAYEPYGGTVVNIPYELRGVPNTTGGWAARDYIEVKDGAVKLVRECAEKTYDGTESWQYASDTSNNVNKDLYYSPTTPGGKAIGWWNNKFVISHFKPANNVTANNMPAATNTNMNGFQLGIYYPVGTFSNLEAFKTYVSGLAEGGNPLTILYQLATPTVEDITETETGQALLALTLTAPDAALSNTAESGMAVRYEVDGTIAYKKQESRLSARIAALEAAIINNI